MQSTTTGFPNKNVVKYVAINWRCIIKAEATPKLRGDYKGFGVRGLLCPDVGKLLTQNVHGAQKNALFCFSEINHFCLCLNSR